jgi:predicted GIY-YIG superfamily endonuclease
MRGLEARFVYVLSDCDPSRHYVGRTTNVDDRLQWHNNEGELLMLKFDLGTGSVILQLSDDELLESIDPVSA